MFYQLYELNHAMMAPWRAAADAMRLAYANPLNPFAHTYLGRPAAKAAMPTRSASKALMSPTKTRPRLQSPAAKKPSAPAISS